MSEEFSFVAFNAAGKRVKGVINANGMDETNERLLRDGLVAITVKKQKVASVNARAAPLKGRQLVEFLGSLSLLLSAGTDIRAALLVLDTSERRPSIQRSIRTLGSQLAAGAPLDEAFEQVLGTKTAIPALLAAGELSGDLAGALTRSAENVETNNKLVETLVSAISYPVFVLLMSSVSIVLLLLFVVPALEPLAQQSGEAAPKFLSVLFYVSEFLHQEGYVILASGAIGLIILSTAWRFNLLQRQLEMLVVKPPFGSISQPLIFGSVFQVFGRLVESKLPVTLALELAARSTRFSSLRSDLNSVANEIRSGVTVSDALGTLHGIPDSIVRLARVGQETGRLGELIGRAARMEQDRALRRVSAISNWIGPALIISLGGFVGLIMAGLLSSITSLGGALSQ